MKILDYDKTLCGPNTIALVTDPPIDADIFWEIERMTRDDLRSPLDSPTPLLSSLRLRCHNGRLIFDARTVDDHIASNVQCLLDEAEKRAKTIKEARKTNAERETATHQNQQQTLIDYATSAFKLPKN